MSSQSLNSEAVLNFIKENKNNLSFVAKVKDIVTSKNDDSFDIPEWHKEVVRERIKNSNPQDYISLEELDNLVTT